MEISESLSMIQMIQIAEVETLSYFYDKDANTIPKVPTCLVRFPNLYFGSRLGAQYPKDSKIFL